MSTAPRILFAAVLLLQLASIQQAVADSSGKPFRGDVGSKPSDDEPTMLHGHDGSDNYSTSGNGSGYAQTDSNSSVPNVMQIIMHIRTLPSVDGNSFPDQVFINFTLSGHDIELNLLRNDNILPQTPVVIGLNGLLESADDIPQDFAFYFEQNYKMSLMVEQISDIGANKTIYLYSGYFQLNDEYYGFEPVYQPSNAKRRKRHTEENFKRIHQRRRIVKRDSSTDVIPHLVFRTADTAVDPYEIYNEPTLSSRFNFTLPSIMASSDGGHIKLSYVVESFAAIDYRIYLKWYNFSQFTTPAERQADAINNIRFYFSHIFNGVDMRYRGINSSNFSISVSLVGFYIALNASGSSFIENNRQDGSPLGYVDAYNAMMDFQKWLTTQQTSLPSYDQASLFTRENLLMSGVAIAGLSIIKGMCGKFSVTVCKDLGEYSTTQTAAHEIGHNLGCGHDGIDNTCNYADQYIMASSPAQLTAANFNNGYKFSNCSISEIGSFLSYLTASPSPSDQCLLHKDAPSLDLSTFLSQLPGQRFSPDQQCQIIYGQGSYYCGGTTEDKQICSSMQCFHPYYRYCYVTYEQRAFTGTTCGNKSWCQMGYCVYDSTAPTAKDNCTYGDYKGPYTNGLSCATIISVPRNHWLCYDPGYFNDCCVGCPSIKNESNVGCEYGDHDVSCSTMGLYGCYNSSTRSLCCDRCRTPPSNVVGCEYGDKASWCSTYIRSSADCYAEHQTCCSSCAKYQTNITSCPYGDSAAWCSSASRLDCYQSNTECCQTCLKLQDPTAVGCEFGDKADWCSGLQSYKCYEDSSTCCHRCRQFATNISGCEYGDRSNVCGPNMQSYDCYNLDNYCCQSCSTFHTGVPGCEYGDRQWWCTASDCSYPDRITTCCQTCSPTRLTSLTTAVSTTSKTITLTTNLTNSATTSSLPLLIKPTPTMSSSSTTYTTNSTTTSPTSSTMTTTTTFTTTIPTTTPTTTTIPTTTPTTTTTITTTTPTTTTIPTTETTTTTTTATTTPTTATTTPTTINTIPTSKTTTTITTILTTAATTPKNSTTTPVTTTLTTTTTPTTTSSTLPSTSKVELPYTSTTVSADSPLNTPIKSSSSVINSSTSTSKVQSISDPLHSSSSAWILVTGVQSSATAWMLTTGSQPIALTTKQNRSSTTTVAPCLTEPYWCSVWHSSVCYDSAATCCITCPRVALQFSNLSPGCMYGDHFYWCDSSYCTDTGLRSECCMSCQGWLTTTTTVPTTITPTPLTAVTSSKAGYIPALGCSTGDLAPYCPASLATDCYFISKTCCASCTRFYTGIEGCEFGDRAPWCSAYVQQSSNCDEPGIAFYCCLTCSTRYKTNCTDHEPWCYLVQPYQCYSDYVQAQSCCQTCKQFRKGNPIGCEYGDQNPWCSGLTTNQCSYYGSNNCCRTCNKN